MFSFLAGLTTKVVLEVVTVIAAGVVAGKTLGDTIKK